MSKKTFSKPLIGDDTDRVLRVVSTAGKMSSDPNIRTGAAVLDAGRFVGRHIGREYTKVRGHVRRTKKGKLTKVRPHLRRTHRYVCI